MPFSLPELPYAYDALAPYMSRETLEFHHDKHHLAYVNNGNNLMKGTEFEGKPVEDVVKSSFFGNPGLFNNAGQHYNHIHFWKWMKPGGGGGMPGDLEKQIVADLGSVAKMKERLHPGRRHPVRLRLVLARGQVRQDRSDEDRERRESRWSTAPGRSSAATCGNTPIISTIATGAPTISRRSSTIWSIGNTSPKCTRRRNR